MMLILFCCTFVTVVLFIAVTVQMTLLQEIILKRRLPRWLPKVLYLVAVVQNWMKVFWQALATCSHRVLTASVNYSRWCRLQVSGRLWVSGHAASWRQRMTTVDQLRDGVCHTSLTQYHTASWQLSLSSWAVCQLTASHRQLLRSSATWLILVPQLHSVIAPLVSIVSSLAVILIVSSSKSITCLLHHVSQANRRCWRCD